MTNWIKRITDTIADLITRTKGLDDTHDDLATHETAQATNRGVVNDIHDTDLPAVKTDTAAIKAQTDKIAGKMLFSMDFWSDPQEELQVTTTSGDKTLPDVTIADLPSGATIVRAIAVLKFRMVENTNAAVNSISGLQWLKVAKDGQSYNAALKAIDGHFTIAGSTREGGDVLMGTLDIAGTNKVDANATYHFKWESAVSLQNNLQFNDVQWGLRIWFSV